MCPGLLFASSQFQLSVASPSVLAAIVSVRRIPKLVQSRAVFRWYFRDIHPEFRRLGEVAGISLALKALSQVAQFLGVSNRPSLVPRFWTSFCFSLSKMQCARDSRECRGCVLQPPYQVIQVLVRRRSPSNGTIPNPRLPSLGVLAKTRENRVR